MKLGDPELVKGLPLALEVWCGTHRSSSLIPREEHIVFVGNKVAYTCVLNSLGWGAEMLTRLEEAL
jgi:hypothetical protein